MLATAQTDSMTVSITHLVVRRTPPPMLFLQNSESGPYPVREVFADSATPPHLHLLIAGRQPPCPETLPTY